MTPERMQEIIDAAQEQLDTGVIYEPRGYPVLFANGSPSKVTAGVGQPIQPLVDLPYLTNGEQFPVKITHVVLGCTDPNARLEFVQRVGLRLRYHDNFYPNPFYMPLAAWQNKPSLLPPYMGRSTAVWTFDKPNILSEQDTLKISVRANALVANTPVDVSVAFHGFGLFSRRPYMIAGTAHVTSTTVSVDVNAIVYRDDSSEPIALYQMVTTVAATGSQSATQGDTRSVLVQVRQSGNSSRANWFQPLRSNDNQLAFDQLPATLTGQNGGQALVHKLDQPWIWNPGEGFTADALNIDLSEIDNHYQFGAMALGHIIIR